MAPDPPFSPVVLPDLSAPRRVHIVGVGGAGMSAIAVILVRLGHRVTGVDVNETGAWRSLAEAGVAVHVVPEAELFAIDPGEAPDILAHSTAFVPPPDWADAARSAGTQIVSRAGILGAICRVRPTVAVSGTHGKTSTTALLATLLEGVGADPSYLVGAVPLGLGRAARWGGDDGVFVVEADESDGTFLALGADTAVVTNVDEDHLDFWGSIEHIEAAFDRFIAGARVGVVCIDSPHRDGEIDERAARIARSHGARTVGEDASADWQLHDVQVERLTTVFGLRHGGAEVGPVRIGTPGRHHARNAAVAVAVAAGLGIAPERAVPALAAYRGVARRFEHVGEARGVTVVDDYAHNPGKVRALIGSALDGGWGRVIVVFQPHRHTRTRDQGLDLGEALAGADLVVVTAVYGAGEAAIPGVTSQIVIDGVVRRRPDAAVVGVEGLEEAVDWLAGRVRPDDLVLTVGAGDVHRVGPLLLGALDREVGS